MHTYRVHIEYWPGAPRPWTDYQPPHEFCAEYCATDEHVAELLGRAQFEAQHGIRTADGCARVALLDEPATLGELLQRQHSSFTVTSGDAPMTLEEIFGPEGREERA